MKVFRWILTPFMFFIGMFIGHYAGMLFSFLNSHAIGALMVEFVCGAAASAGAILLPTYVAPNKKYSVGTFTFWCQIVFLVVAIILSFVVLSGRELFLNLVSTAGGFIGALWIKGSLSDFLENK